MPGKSEIELSLAKVKFSTLIHSHQNSVHQCLAMPSKSEIGRSLAKVKIHIMAY